MRYLDVDVYTAARERIARLFADFDQVLVAFSGGKDSGVCLNLAYEVAREVGALDRLAFYHQDYEAQYQHTTDYVGRVFDSFPDIKRRYWLCLPIKAGCSVSMYQDHWIPWNPAEKGIWVRPMPDHPAVVTLDNVPWPFSIGAADDGRDSAMQRWLAQQYGSTAVVLGIRTDESLHRYAAIAGRTRRRFHAGLRWTTPVARGLVNAYPIYDWSAEDIWTANARFGWDYNRLYDLFYQAGLTLDQMRVASPFHEWATSSLPLYKAVDPDSWGRMISRVNGVNFAGLYGGTTAMGWRSITKPDHFTWEEYFHFLVETLPAAMREKILGKVRKSRFAWATVGEARTPEFIAQVQADGAKVERTGIMSNRTAEPTEVIRIHDYLDDTTAKDFTLVPTWKRACICILKNDYAGLYMGFGRTKTEIEARARAIELWEKAL